MTEAESGTGTPLTPAEARAFFPGLERFSYFATNGQALLPKPTRDRMVSAIDGLMQRGYGGASQLENEVESVRAKVARLLNAGPDEIGFVRNTGEGLSFAAEAIDWKSGDEVLVFAGDYRSVVHAFQAVAYRGVQVRVSPTDEGRVTADLIERQLRDRTRAVALSWVRYDTGAQADLVAIGALLEQAGVLFVVDAIQGLGVLPIDPRAAGVHILAAGAHKWLLGLSGTGILWVRRELVPALLPIHIGVGSMADGDVLHGGDDPYVVQLAPGARRVEEGARKALGIVALGESLDFSNRVGADAIAVQVKRVTDRLCDGFHAVGGQVRSPRGKGEWSGIVLLEPPPGIDAGELALRMIRERVFIGSREGALWGGAHYFTSVEDADRLLSFL
jgi:selenocysteine lyase/cysteine desulfurase